MQTLTSWILELNGNLFTLLQCSDGEGYSLAFCEEEKGGSTVSNR